MKLLLIIIFVVLILSGCATDSIKEQCQRLDAAQNEEQARKYFANLQNDRDVKVSDSGLRYKILRYGSGDIKPSKGSEIIAHYEIRRLDGSIIDSSYDRGRPAIFKIEEVFTGWRMALEEMVQGEKRIVYLPPELAFGCAGQKPKIGSNETLVFTTELVKFKELK